MLLLGWSLDDSREEFSRAEMIELFTLDRVNKSPASFDPQKLWAFEDRHMRGVPVDQQGARGARSIYSGPASSRRRRRRASGQLIARVIAAAGDRIKTMGDILQFREFFVADDSLPIEGADFDKLLKAPGAVALLREFLRHGSSRSKHSSRPRSSVSSRRSSRSATSRSEQLVHPLRFAVTGRTVGLGSLRCARDLGPRAVDRAHPPRRVGRLKN